MYKCFAFLTSLYHQALVEKYIDKDREDARGVKRKVPATSSLASTTSATKGGPGEGGLTPGKAEGAVPSTVAPAKPSR